MCIFLFSRNTLGRVLRYTEYICLVVFRVQAQEHNEAINLQTDLRLYALPDLAPKTSLAHVLHNSSEIHLIYPFEFSVITLSAGTLVVLLIILLFDLTQVRFLLQLRGLALLALFFLLQR